MRDSQCLPRIRSAPLYDLLLSVAERSHTIPFDNDIGQSLFWNKHGNNESA